jgi:glucose-6-phosphate 1-dehydrogenase
LGLRLTRLCELERRDRQACLPTLDALTGTSVPQGSRVVIEKPFGEDLAWAQVLNRLLHRPCPENAVLRIDHCLHLQTVQSVLELRACWVRRR